MVSPNPEAAARHLERVERTLHCKPYRRTGMTQDEAEVLFGTLRNGAPVMSHQSCGPTFLALEQRGAIVRCRWKQCARVTRHSTPKRRSTAQPYFAAAVYYLHRRRVHGNREPSLSQGQWR